MIRTTIAAAAASLFTVAAADAATVATGATIAGDTAGIVSGGAASYGVGHSAYSSEVTTPASAWVWNGTAAFADTTYTFSFDLTGYDLSTVSLTGKWGVDNVGSISLNGGAAFDALAYGTGAFNTLHDYSVSSGFVAGVNNLVFTVQDQGAPGAFRATAIVEADLSAVPLPASAPLLLAAFGGVAALRRKRKN